MTDEPELQSALAEAAADVTNPSAKLGAIVAGGRRRRRRRRLGYAGLVASVAAAVSLGGAGLAGTFSAHEDRLLVASPGPTATGPAAEPACPGAASDGSARTGKACTAPAASPDGAGTPPGYNASVAPAGATTTLPVTLPAAVAVVDDQGIALLQDDTRTELSGTANATYPALSHDGVYLSWLTTGSSSSTLHIRNLQSGEEHAVQQVTAATWSPVADTLAACGNGLSVVSAAGSTSPTRKGTCSYRPVWSADGLYIAAVLDKNTGIYSMNADSNVPYPPQVVTTLPYSAGIARFVGDDAVLLWPDPSYSSSLAADGLTLTEYDITSGKGFPLTTTLAYPDWVQPSLARAGAASTMCKPADQPCANYAIVTGGDRDAHSGKQLEDWYVPDHPTAADPPRQAKQSLTTTGLLSVTFSANGIRALVTSTDAPGGPYSVDGTLSIGGKPVAGITAGAVVAPGYDIYVLGRKTLEVCDGSETCTPLGAIRDVLGNDVNYLPSYYGHVDPAQVISALPGPLAT